MEFYEGPLGIKIRKEFERPFTSQSMSSGRWSGEGLGGEDFVEFGFLQKAVNQSESSFTMVELGAGYGRWMMNAAKLCERKGIQAVNLIGVEASKKRFEFITQHFSDNVPVNAFLELHCVGVGPYSGWASIADNDDYGASLGAPGDTQVLTLAELIPPGTIDYLCMDIQGMEADILESAKDVLHRCRFIHVATHGKAIAERCREAMKDMPFKHVTSAPQDVVYAGARFIDGMEQWIRLN